MNYGIRFRFKMWNENSNYSHICGLKSDLAAVYGHFLTNITRTYFIKRGVSKLIGAFIRDILPELNKNRKWEVWYWLYFYLAMCQVNLTDMTIVYVPSTLFTTFNQGTFLWRILLWRRYFHFIVKYHNLVFALRLSAIA